MLTIGWYIIHVWCMLDTRVRVEFSCLFPTSFQWTCSLDNIISHQCLIWCRYSIAARYGTTRLDTEQQTEEFGFGRQFHPESGSEAEHGTALSPKAGSHFETVWGECLEKSFMKSGVWQKEKRNEPFILFLYSAFPFIWFS